MDITPVFNEVLVRLNGRPIEPPVFRVEDLDEFLQEAYRIRAHVTKLHRDLKAIRQSYLSTTHPPRRKQYTRPGSGAEKEKETKYLSDAERNEVDASAKQSLRELNYAIEMLNDAEQMRQVTQSEVALRKRAKKGLGALGRWAAGGAITAKSVDEEIEESRANTLKAHRESIIWSLQRQLEACGQFQGSMMTIRLEREVEKSKSVLYKTRGTGPAMNNYDEMNDLHSTVPETDYRGKSNYALEERHSEIEQTLDPEQLQLFAQENQDMLKQYEDQLDKVRASEKSLLEISELQSQLAGNLGVQTEHINRLVEDSFSTVDNVGSGNRELRRATERRSTARMVFWGTCAFCSTLVLWDLFI